MFQDQRAEQSLPTDKTFCQH